MNKGLTYEEAQHARPVGYIFQAQTLSNDLVHRPQLHITFGDKQQPEHIDVYVENVVNALKVQISNLEGQVQGLQEGSDQWRTKYEAERQRQFTAAGWFFPRVWITDDDSLTLNQTIETARVAPNVMVSFSGHGIEKKSLPAAWIKNGFEVTPEIMPSMLSDKAATLFEAIKHGDETHQAWLKEAIRAHFAGEPVPAVVMKAEVEEAAQDTPSDDQTWVVKLGAAAGRFHNPVVINKSDMDRLEYLQKATMERCGMPQSQSLKLALDQLFNELLWDMTPLHDLVLLATGAKKESEVFWGQKLEGPTDLQKAYVRSFDELGSVRGDLKRVTKELSEVKRVGKQAGVVCYDGGRLRFYDIGDPTSAALKAYDVFFEEGKFPEELSPAYVTAEQVGLAANPEQIDDVVRSWLKGADVHVIHVNPAKDLPYKASLPVQNAQYVQALDNYTQALDATIDAFVSESMFKTSPDYMEKLKEKLRDHYLNQWKQENAPLYFGEDACMYPGTDGKCCVRNRECDRCILKAAPIAFEPGVQDNSSRVVNPHQGRILNPHPNLGASFLGSIDESRQAPVTNVPFYTAEELKNPTNLQKVTIMAMVGTEAQQAEAREFMKQFLAL